MNTWNFNAALCYLGILLIINNVSSWEFRPKPFLRAALFYSVISNPSCSFSAEDNSNIVLSGIVDISPSTSMSFKEGSALYVTAREDFGLWTSAVRNIKAPPILTKRIANIKSFPITVSLDLNDLTPEGVASKKSWSTGKLPLTISSRFDMDGVASTRDPDDLVGISKSEFKGGKFENFRIELGDRGIGGKLVTKKQ